MYLFCFTLRTLSPETQIATFISSTQHNRNVSMLLLGCGVLLYQPRTLQWRSKCVNICILTEYRGQTTAFRAATQHRAMQKGKGTCISSAFTHWCARIDPVQCSMHSWGNMATSLWNSRHASHIHPDMSHLLKHWPLLTWQIFCRKSTTKPETSQLHLCALLQGTSLGGSGCKALYYVLIFSRGKLHSLAWECVAAPPPPPPPSGSQQSARNLTCFTHFLHKRPRRAATLRSGPRSAGTLKYPPT